MNDSTHLYVAGMSRSIFNGKDSDRSRYATIRVVQVRQHELIFVAPATTADLNRAQEYSAESDHVVPNALARGSHRPATRPHFESAILDTRTTRLTSEWDSTEARE